ncbi:tetraspanin-16 isoform X2 [Echinops telfairi]|uniref:Tetraspanin n=1 Tax=Echinops telfairi TaxID=9371 RepID=A0ABM0ZTS6_ECHTE|nr:tetraspanin-16 isoform X2 [Echinops telfairi]
MAEMHTPYSSLKKLLFFLNGLVAMSGVLLIGLGTWMNGKAALTRVLGLSSVHLLHIGCLSLAMGCGTVPLGLAGWYGATKEHRGILLFVNDLALEHTLATLREHYKGYNEPDDYSAGWNLVMAKLRCCGVNNYTDFVGSSFETMTGRVYPRSCCKSAGATACDGHSVSRQVIHQKGCFHKLMRLTKIQCFTLSGGLLGAVAVQVPGILATWLLFAKLG